MSTPISVTREAATAVEEVAGSQLLATSAILDAGFAAQDAHPKWELHTLVVEGVTLQMRFQMKPSPRFLVTTD